MKPSKSVASCLALRLSGGMGGQSLSLNGVRVWKDFLSPDQQRAMVHDLREIAASAPFRRYETPGGRKMSVRMSAAGQMGWMADRAGYRYEPSQPDGAGWPDIPKSVLDVWRTLADTERDPDSCLINFYGEGAKMGMHQDKDEGALSWPVLSISLGDDALFRVGGTARGGSTESIWLQSGDVALLSGDARLAYHGIDRIRFRSSNLLPDGGRLNVTLRVAG